MKLYWGARIVENLLYPQPLGFVVSVSSPLPNGLVARAEHRLSAEEWLGATDQRAIFEEIILNLTRQARVSHEGCLP